MRPVRRTRTTRTLGATVLATAVLAATALLAGCGADDGSPSPEEETVSTSPVPGADSPVVNRAKSDLATQLGIDVEEISVLRVEEVTWRDGSLGCARKGMAYTQALVDGQRIVLAVDGKEYEFHSGGRTAPFYCDRPTQ
ncbi:MAG: hypothetical protein LT071_02980 [Nocardioides sp.]|nr:hypothetical protein [Nocardioides sp.]